VNFLTDTTRSRSSAGRRPSTSTRVRLGVEPNKRLSSTLLARTPLRWLRVVDPNRRTRSSYLEGSYLHNGYPGHERCSVGSASRSPARRRFRYDWRIDGGRLRASYGDAGCERND
jgi:hypothetical protein